MDSVLMWFRRDLRLTDNAALSHALQAAARVHCVFVFDTAILAALPQRDDRRVAFIHAGVAALAQALAAAGGGLHVLHGDARQVIPALAANLNVAAVYAGRDYEPFARARDAAVAAALAQSGRTLRLVKDQVVFDTDELCTQAGSPYHVFTPYRRAWLARLAACHGSALAPHPVREHLTRLAAGPLAPPPSLAALGFSAPPPSAPAAAPGEAGAQARWAEFRTRLAHYHQTRDYPGLNGPSCLSVHLRFGTISVRELAREAWSNPGDGAATWLAELIWREFYQMLLWHYPHTADHALQARLDALPWPNPTGHFEAWCAARTGYPIVDAALRQLNQTGYMHNRLRMIAASFLVKDLHVDWRLGERYFAARLLDYDQAANVGGWQWCASVGTDAQPWFRIFNPVTQSRRFDPQGDFIRRYLPELAALPDKHLHAPWCLPAAEQTRLGFVPGRDYPLPRVDHARARQTTLALFRAALAPVQARRTT